MHFLNVKHIVIMLIVIIRVDDFMLEPPIKSRTTCIVRSSATSWDHNSVEPLHLNAVYTSHASILFTSHMMLNMFLLNVLLSFYINLPKPDYNYILQAAWITSFILSKNYKIWTVKFQISSSKDLPPLTQ